jgi:hypothetical protein
VLLLIIIHKAGNGVVVATSEHARGSLLFLDYRRRRISFLPERVKTPIINQQFTVGGFSYTS